MVGKMITSMLLASSMLATLPMGHVDARATDTTVHMDLVKSEAAIGFELEESDLDNPFTSLEDWIAEKEAMLEEGRTAANAAAEAAEKSAKKAQAYADKTDGEEIDEAAETAAVAAKDARDAAVLASITEDPDAMALAVETAETAQANAKEAASGAKKAAKAEAAAKKAEEAARKAEEAARKEQEMKDNAELLGTFTLTAYCPCARCCGRAGAPTASGVMPTAGHTVAMGGIEFGTKLLINDTIYTVEDRGTGYGHVDIFMNSHDEALQFGLQHAEVYLIKE